MALKALILHASAGNGHRRAAEALAQAFAVAAPGSVTAVRDILDFTPAIFRSTYAKGYLRVVRSAPELWGYWYSRTDEQFRIPWRRKVRSTFNTINTINFFEFYDEFAPDLTVCTHFMPLDLLSSRSRRNRTHAPFYCACTDFSAHSLWIVEDVDCYYVACEEARRQFIRRGQQPDRTVVTGIPISPEFARPGARSAARRLLGVSDTLPTLLVMSGGFGVGPTVELIQSFEGSALDCQLLVVAGANKDLLSRAEAAASRLRQPCRVFGFVDNMHELMDASDIVVSKPGGLSASEILAKGRPMIIVDPIPGQEQRNCEYILQSGAGVRLFEPEDAPDLLATLLSDPDRLRRMEVCAAAIGRPNAAVDLVRDVLARFPADREARIDQPRLQRFRARMKKERARRARETAE